MIISNFNTKFYGVFSLLVLVLSGAVFAQEKSKIIYKNDKQWAVAERNNVFCAGYIQTSPLSTSFELIGADDEAEQFVYSENEFVYVNRGSSSGVRAGDVYSVIRPRGQVKSKFSKKGKLGFYVQEVGSIEIIRVKAEVSVARVKTSCDNFLLGDLLEPLENRVAPSFNQRPALDIFAESSGKTTGRIVMARDTREVLGREQIAYIDLGAEDNVKEGDYLTVFRPLGKTKIVKVDEDETLDTQRVDYASDTFQGSQFSIAAPRRDGSTAEGKRVTTKDAKNPRPNNLRKIVGEAVILKVKERTATVLIVRNAQEIHPGDMVEIQ